jgi:hypothetical protein
MKRSPPVLSDKGALVRRTLSHFAVAQPLGVRMSRLRGEDCGGYFWRIIKAVIEIDLQAKVNLDIEAK